MTEKDLIELIDALKRQKCEKQYVEVKKALGGTSKKLYDTLSSFSNQNDGGTIIFGVDEKAGYEVTGVYDAQDLQVQVKNAAEQMEPVVRPFFLKLNPSHSSGRSPPAPAGYTTSAHRWIPGPVPG